MEWHVFTDGGSRGNPGSAACAFVVKENGKEITAQARSLGVCTNNEAEYAGLLDSIAFIAAEIERSGAPERVLWSLDSKLVVEQVLGNWRVKEPRLQSLCLRARENLEQLPCSYQLIHVPREKNARADQLLNDQLDLI